MKKYLFLLLALGFNVVSAEVYLYEQEPNNTPLSGNHFKAPMILLGNMQKGDQDMFVWEISDADADYLWNVELDGLPGRLTQVDFMRLTFAENGKDVTQIDNLFSVKNYGGSSTVKKAGFIFSAGTYYLGLSFAGESSNDEAASPLLGDSMLKDLGDEYVKDNQQIDKIKVVEQNAYQLKINKGKKPYSLTTKNNSKTNPTALREKSLTSVYFDEKTKWLSIDINEKEAQQYWQISGNSVIGEALKLNFYAANAELQATTTTDSYGYFSLPDLRLAVGQYLIELISTENAVTSIELQDKGELIENNESEPNDYFKNANQILLGNIVTGQVGKTGENDYFKFDVSEEQSQNQLEIKLSNSENSQLELCLYSNDSTQLQCKTNKGDINLVQLILSQGSYSINVARGTINTQYTLEIVDKGSRNKLTEAEPNDKFVNATSMNPKRMIKGETVGEESDYFYFEVDQQEQMWTVQAIGESITNLSIYNAGGKSIQEQRFPPGSKRARLSNLHLMPGKHVVRVYGKNSQYLLRAFPTGPVDHALEFEPNDSKKQAMALKLNEDKKGLLQNLTDNDFYRFHLNNEQGVHLIIQSPTDGDIQYYLDWEGMSIGRKFSAIGGKIEYKGLLPAGDYNLQLKAHKTSSDDLYQLNINYFDASGCVVDCEPNDTVNQANLIHAPMILTGKSGTHNDDDWYKLPAFDTETLVTFQNNENKKGASVSATIKYGNTTIYPTLDAEQKHFSFLIPANENSYYRLSGADQTYNWTVLIDNKESEVPENYQDIHLKLQNMPLQVQAYSSQAQNIIAELLIENSGTKAQSFNIHSKSTDYRWLVQIDEAIQELPAGAKISLPVEVKVPADAIRNQPVRLSFTAKDNNTVLTHTWQDIKVELNSALINPSNYWSIADQLLGGVNVAATAMGSKRTEQDLAFNINAIGMDFDDLFDGLSIQGLGMQYRGGRKTEQDFITIELAGDKLIDVKGIILNPLSKVAPYLYLKDFDFQLSTDGINFQSVLKGQVSAIIAEQSFVLDKIVAAKFARLYFLTSHENKNKSGMGLGEWKVIANPAQTISEGFNIADPKLGGHVAWASPESSGSWNINILTEDAEKGYARSSDNNEWQWVVGFHNQRAAKITKIQLQPPQVDITGKSYYELLKKIKVYVSLNSNVGPWKLIAEKDLSTTNAMDEITLEQETWARFVKFSANSVTSRNYAYFPETIRIFEQKVNENYQSILGEWGELSENAIYEKLNPPVLNQILDDENNNSKQTAIDLSDRKNASGLVQLEQADKPDWYKYQPKAGENTLNISLSGKQNIETVIQLEDTQGNLIPLINTSSDTNKIEYQIPVNSDSEYFIKVEEPPRSVIFSWDTSGSTGAYESMIYDAISSYSNDVITGRDTVNFLPFGGELLMEDWYGQPYYLKTILNNYRRNDDSSSAETTLLKASKALEKRQGSKSIIVITDAITGKDSKMWDSFRKVHPRIFSIGIIGNSFGGDPNLQIDLMQSWSRVNNGDFQQVITAAQVEQAFDRVASKLRQPADYSLTISSEFIKAPGPGQLLIQQDQSQQLSAVELILDASGSMLKRLDGKRRIDIAKEVLINAITEIIPEKTPLALRVFGDKQANSCRTDLAIKLNPLDRTKAKEVLSNIYAKNLAKTPIADSLAQVASDLKNHNGKKIIILVTDGEETCDGNPEEVIAQLIDNGLDIRLNIVGFAIDDEALKEQFNQWSNQGGGKYFDSNNPESLKESVSQALKIPYSVYSISDELIQEGVVNGEALQLPAGHYNIKVFANVVKTYANYKIQGEMTQTINLLDGE